MKETIRIELTQGQYQQLKEIGVSNSEIKSYGCTHPSSGVTIDHYMTVGVKKSVTGGDHKLDNIDAAPIQVESLAGGTEWKNGDECVYTGQPEIKCKFVAIHPNNSLCAIIWEGGGDVNLSCVAIDCIAKPETEAERNERERLEAAYGLYCIYQSADNIKACSFDSFKESSVMAKKWISIVDETGYRKAVTNE